MGALLLEGHLLYRTYYSQMIVICSSKQLFGLANAHWQTKEQCIQIPDRTSVSKVAELEALTDVKGRKHGSS